METQTQDTYIDPIMKDYRNKLIDDIAGAINRNMNIFGGAIPPEAMAGIAMGQLLSVYYFIANGMGMKDSAIIDMAQSAFMTMVKQTPEKANGK